MSYFTSNNNLVWYTILNDILSNYNNRKHSVTKIAPNKALYNIQTISSRIKQKAFHNLQLAPKYPTIYLSDYVRLSLQTTVDYRKATFRKKYLNQWSTEIYTVVSIIPAKLLSSDKYTLVDQNNTLTKRRYFRYQLQKIDKNAFIPIKKKT